MRIREVTVRHGWKDFLAVPAIIYANDPEYIPHLRQDLKSALGPKNGWRKEGGCRLWVAEDGDKVVGRIAAFHSKTKKLAGIGFFESINNSSVANALFDTALHFLSEEGYRKAEGPINFGERDKYWGLMVKGFKRPGYQENYNPPYYQALFEDYGFQKSFDQTTQEITPAKLNLKKIRPLGERILNNPAYEVVHINKKHLDKFAEDFVYIYNKAWTEYEHYVPLTKMQVLKTMRKMKPILREDLIWFTYVEGEPAAFYVSVIDVNQLFKKVWGNFNWWGKIKFIYYKRRIKIDRIRGIIFGVIPEYQGRGLAGGMIMKIFDVFEKDPHLKSSEMAWVGDFNPKMLGVLNSLGAEPIKAHITYYKKI